ncbi:hypothetical protein CYMTET_38030 [Cymbomonas tetramitiformis]|uniref:peptidylprolyl isomerase n=1 Tax=Cymbomonas tetramitiformis TaxID=36881 RepID=A0AAE0CCW3_9CHLO|nr:hypothetical protein CYMTET_38030 [Cymbomonas tetramitiformis]|eukprot:gene20550-24624_t
MTGSFEQAEASTCVEMPALQGRGYCKPATIYEDYVLTDSGLQYKDFRLGAGDVPQAGDKVVVDWDGYTVGYFGRIIQAKNLSKGGAFEDGDVGFLRFTLDSGAVIPAFEEALYGMRVGGIRRILVPPGPLNYPEDTGFKKIGPVPDTRSGKNALGFVVVNEGAIDKTLLFDIELLGIGANAKARRAEGTWIAGPFAENK